MTRPAFLGVAWGWPTAKGRQLAHLVAGEDPETCNRSVCGVAVRVWPKGPGLAANPAHGYDSHGRPMLTCRRCRRSVSRVVAEWRR